MLNYPKIRDTRLQTNPKSGGIKLNLKLLLDFVYKRGKTLADTEMSIFTAAPGW